MWYIRTLLGLLGLGLMGFAPAPLPRDRSNEVNLRTLQGVWKLVDVRKEGKAEIDDATKLQDIRFEIKGETFRTLPVGPRGPGTVYRLTLDSSRSPVWMTLSRQEGDNVQLIEGVVRLQGDRLTFCYALPGVQPVRRPERFDTDQKGQMQMTLVREKR
jgi:uncharacterized protein (TIGR03067 family)